MRKFIVIVAALVLVATAAERIKPAQLAGLKRKFSEHHHAGNTAARQAEIKASGVTSVNDAIMKLLGVPGRVDFYGGGDYALDLRGFGTTADNNQVVIVDVGGVTGLVSVGW